MTATFRVLLPGVMLILGGCAATDESLAGWRLVGETLDIDGSSDESDRAADSPFEAAPQEEADAAEAEIAVRRVPTISDFRMDGARTFGESAAEPSGGPLNVTLPPQPLPQFINTVFGEILGVPFSMGPNVAESSEVISLRSVREMPRDTFFALVQEALKDYGFAVQVEDDLYRIIALDELRAQIPEFITSRAGPHVPSDLRPVVQFVELTAAQANEMEDILRQAFPEEADLQIRVNRRTNSMVLSGLSEDVDLALSIIKEMDELRYADTEVLSFSPRNWDVTELSATVTDIMSVEGYVVGQRANPSAITLLPLEFTNQLMVFASDPEVGRYAIALAQRLDRDAFDAEVAIPHIYQVRNARAEDLAAIASAVLGDGGGSLSQTSSNQSGETGSEARQERLGGDPSQAPSRYGDFTVDALGNRIIFRGTLEEYEEIETLLSRLDTRQPEVLIEVIIAEVQLTDSIDYGLDAVFDSEAAATFAARLESQGGLSGVVTSGQVSLSASSAANNNQINILSTPRIVTRSGSSASIQVGSDVPVITSQRAAPTQESGSTDVLQQVQYRSTGVLLNVEPRVFSGDRIDLIISQELSSAEPNDTAQIASPIISNRSIESELSLKDGQTAVLGGLIEDRFTRGNSGVPFLKDVPLLGAPFRSQNLSSTRTMVVVLVTPYVLNTQDDRAAIVRSLRRAINDAFENQTSASPTLRPRRAPMRVDPAPEG